jgi:hypothetical protein
VLIVTAELPVEDKVRVCVVAVLTLTLPNGRLDGLTLNVDVPPFSCSAKVFATLLVLAVNVTV